MRKSSKPKQKTKKNKRTVVITYTQDLDDARKLRERIVDSYPELGTDYYLIKATSFLRDGTWIE